MEHFRIFSSQIGIVNFNVRSYEHYKYDKGYRGFKHAHLFIEIFIVLKGKGYLKTPTQEIELRPNMVVVNNAGVTHFENVDEAEGLEYVVVCVDQAFVNKQSKEEFEDTAVLSPFNEYEEIKLLIGRIEREWREKQYSYQEMIKGYLDQIIISILRPLNLDLKPIHEIGIADMMVRVDNYLLTHYDEDITLNELADMFSVSKYYLCRAYKKKYGKTIIERLNIVRCEEAKRLIEKCDHTITEISILVGYASVSYFSETYKEVMGESPLATRRRANISENNS